MSPKSYQGNAKMIWEVIRAQRGTQLTFSRWCNGVLIFTGEDPTGHFCAELHWRPKSKSGWNIDRAIGMPAFDVQFNEHWEFAGTRLSYYCWQSDQLATYTLDKKGQWVEANECDPMDGLDEEPDPIKDEVVC